MESKNHQEKKSSSKKKKDLIERLQLDLINIKFFKDEIERLQTENTECNLEIKQAYEKIKEKEHQILDNKEMIIANKRGITNTENHLNTLMQNLKLEE